jgi:hypothetical protein
MQKSDNFILIYSQLVWLAFRMLLIQMRYSEFKYEGGNSFKKNKQDLYTEQTNA